ncbi:UDP-N-acetylglucosamine--N-acetylmuramyl-(pentapeptide) pyrophosphoryl-undecaprenol N-acetylglucosamine transferase [Candidatus Uhrbacteria bacterium]|nr:UDP-N-acetylglucosamine--N-acetylmuramyl-(pentapeptide) pyrophosphoryl-undecaprenol N-acetylglucosamine transferase [Candidatus Uhrbacteria bacterium]
MRILFTGGGTLGPVTPLLALYEYLCDHSSLGEVKAAWIGTRHGPEWSLISQYRIIQIRIFAGKIRRYISIHNLIDPFFLFFGFFQALYHILRFRPTVVVNAGSFVGVGVVWAAWFVGIPVVALQLDIRPSLANILTLLHSKKICASCPEAAKKFPKNRTVITGIPVRKSVSATATRICQPGELQRLRAQHGIYDTLPVVLMSGGGTGAEFLNARARELAQDGKDSFHIMHITGKGKEITVAENKMYHQFSFVDDFASIAACADIVVTRAGMGTISELVVLGKPMILIPIPDSHQVDNALFCEKKGAAVYLSQTIATTEHLREVIEKVLRNKDRKAEFVHNMRTLFPSNAAARMAEIL